MLGKVAVSTAWAPICASATLATPWLSRRASRAVRVSGGLLAPGCHPPGSPHSPSLELSHVHAHVHTLSTSSWWWGGGPGVGRWSSTSPAASCGAGRLQDLSPSVLQIEMSVSSPLPAQDSDASTPPARTAASARRALPWGPEDSVKVKLPAACCPSCRAEYLSSLRGCLSSSWQPCLGVGLKLQLQGTPWRSL